ncbi:helix-turn-helix transcriptional regulator [Escherichia coli]|uniref:helix-turn-helix transcriptional regulator n=1 Tax=Escherichia coli TaxID=562 RepID=UPI00191B3079|nr:helix-turn-helix transcriptional regulator [Escherichia coli]EIQ2268000.1 helix-turn-helix transcriptional regulator [Escherichia coli]CAD6116571.1 putative signal transduction protein [Escherichia coli]CAD6167375.1 putative signal transduction protein [Escherichia coli]HAZ3610416.1 helix-turn-helix transcriptional regulator [Escherichia coli]HAZ3680342.1 helix-turn-helix transcriptional regulator [Escherichia coli]
MKEKTTYYVSTYIKKHDIDVHIWITSSITKAECKVLELLLKGYTISMISESRGRSVKTVSLQKHQIYKKLGIRNDITFWLDLSLSPYVKIKLAKKIH